MILYIHIIAAVPRLIKQLLIIWGLNYQDISASASIAMALWHNQQEAPYQYRTQENNLKNENQKKKRKEKEKLWP